MKRPARREREEAPWAARLAQAGIAHCIIVHDKVAGRLRVRSLRLARHPRACDDVVRRLLDTPGINGVRASPLTGSLLVAFDPSKLHHEILREAMAAIASTNRVRHPAAAEGQKAPRVRKPLAPLPHAFAPPADATAWHTVSAAAVLERVGGDAADGLTPVEASDRLKTTGPNKLAERKGANPAVVFLQQFNSLPLFLLLGAAAFSVATGGLADAAVTIAVVIANAGIGYGVERGSERVILEMTKRRGHSVPVLRGGTEIAINSNFVVPGDILILRPNVVIAADARVLAAEGLQLNEALLTGESRSVAKSAEALKRADIPLGERANMVYRGAFVAAGSGRAVVVATGGETEVGRLALAGQEAPTPPTPLERDLEKLGTQLALVSLAICGGFAGLGVMRGRPLASVLKSAIALAVAAIPEGLTVTSTATLALGLRQLKRQGIVVRRLESVEALGAMQILCLDKTGTLTLDRMDVEALCLGAGEHIVVPDCGDTVARHALHLAEISVLCSDALIEQTDAGERTSGSATEVALLRLARGMGIDPAALRRVWPQSRIEYRSGYRRYMVSYHRRREPQETLVAVKGDPVQLLEMCSTVMDANGGAQPLDAAARNRLLQANDEMAGQGLRVLGFAYGGAEQWGAKHLTWAGMAGLKAPFFAGARELLSRLHMAGVRPVIITGDQAATAEAIARDIGLTEGRPVRLLDSVALSALPPDIRDAVVQRTDVFARIPPSQKLEIVRALQRSGKVVGMAGDGFNDALALKAADIAIAVGRGKTSAAGDVADIIVTNQDLNVIGDGIAQGRTILSNIRKSVHYMLATNLSEVLVVFAESFGTAEELETPLELLWVNLVSDTLPGLGLALEPPELNVMKRPPRDATEPLLRFRDLHHAVTESLILGAAVLGAHGYARARYGPGSQTRTVTFLSLVAAQLLHALTCRRDRFVALGGRSLFGNRALNLALAGSAALQAAPIIWPRFGRLLGIAPVRGADLGAAALTALISFGLNEAALAFRSRKRLGGGAAEETPDA